MCPPESIPPAVELNEYSTDEAVFMSLMQIKAGSSLPSNVLSDVDPYQFRPSNLPVGVWYLWSGSKTETENGFWRSTGETRETCSSLITCSRKTLQFYEGTTSEGQKTNLMMQEYTTNDECSGQQDPRALYKVYLIDADSGSGRLSESEFPVKNLDDVARPSTVANQSPDRLLGDYVSRGDYLELYDLAIPLSRSTSADSSCMTRSVTSEDLFDSNALLCELGDDNVDHDSSLKLNLSAPAKLKEVVVQPTTLESLDKEPKPCTGQTSKTNPTPESEPGYRCNNSTSNEAGTSSSSSSSSSSGSSEGSSKEERKNRTKKRKMMKYLCFLAF